MTQTVALETLSLAALAAVYNTLGTTEVKKFADKQSAVRRTQAALDAAGRVLVAMPDANKFGVLAVPAPVEAAPTDEPLPTSHVDSGSRFDVYAPPADAAKPERPEYAKYPTKSVQMGDALQQVLGSDAKSDVPPPAPATPAEKQAKAKPAKKTATGHRGPQARYTDAMRFTRVDPNPRRKGAESHERYALYQVGMTVAEYIDLCLEKYGRDRARWLTDVRWDADAGHIAVE